MFSENQKISGRQAFRLLTYDLLGLGTLLVPTVLARIAGRDGIFCIAIGMAAGLLYLRMIRISIRDMKGSFPEYLEQKLGVFAGRLIQLGYLMYFILLAGYTSYLFSDIVLCNLLREESFWLVLALILLLTGYGLWGGIEGRARVTEILFWVVLIPLFFMLFSAANEIDVDYWMPVFSAGKMQVLEGSYYVFLCLSLVFLVLFLGRYTGKRTVLFRAGRMALVFTGVIYGILYLILLGIFGTQALASMDFPAVTMMSTVKISGGFLKRADALMFGIWFFTLYAILSSAAFYSGTLFCHLLGGIGEGKKNRRERIVTLLILALTFVAAGSFYGRKNLVSAYEWFLWYIGTPFIVLVPLALALCVRFKKEGRQIAKNLGGAALLLLLGSLLSGCNTAELEDRNFPIEMAVNDTKDFGAEWLNVENTGDRVIDYSHLKVILLSRSFLEDAASMEEFLDLLEKKSDVPRNTYVVCAEDAKEILEIGNDTVESVGSYLEEYFQNVSEVKKKVYPTLGMLYQERQNRMETLFIPFVEADESKLIVNRYYVWKRGRAAGEIDTETALLSFFSQNEVGDYTLIPQGGHYVRLFEPHNEISILEENGEKIVVDIYCSGEALYQQEVQEEDQRRLEGELREYMNRTAKTALKNLQIDVANSYKKLGGLQRDWYLEYKKNGEVYESKVDIVYNVHVDWVNL